VIDAMVDEAVKCFGKLTLTVLRISCRKSAQSTGSELNGIVPAYTGCR
jgi:hypothetical protein